MTRQGTLPLMFTCDHHVLGLCQVLVRVGKYVQRWISVALSGASAQHSEAAVVAGLGGASDGSPSVGGCGVGVAMEVRLSKFFLHCIPASIALAAVSASIPRDRQWCPGTAWRPWTAALCAPLLEWLEEPRQRSAQTQRCEQFCGSSNVVLTQRGLSSNPYAASSQRVAMLTSKQKVRYAGYNR